MVGFGRYRRPFRWSSSPRADNQELPAGCILMIVIPVMFVVSSYFAWWELRYFAQGKTVDAVVDEVREVTKGRRYARSTYFAVTYLFDDETLGQARRERDDVPTSWERPAQLVRVEYIPGREGRSRLAGHRSHFSVVFFVVCLAISIIYAARLFLEARQATRSEANVTSRRR